MALPEGYPAQLIEGCLVKQPAPRYGHQLVALDICSLLLPIVGRGRVILAPADVPIDEFNVYPVSDRQTGNRPAMAPTKNPPSLDTTTNTAPRPTANRPRTPTRDHPDRTREPELGLPAHPRRTRARRPPTRSLNRVEDPACSGHRPDTRPHRSHMVGVHQITIQSNHRHRLRLRRHRNAQTVPCAVRHRTRHTTCSSRRDHDQPHRPMDYPSCTHLHDATRRASSVPILDPRRSRTIICHVMILPARNSRRSDHGVTQIPDSPKSGCLTSAWCLN